MAIVRNYKTLRGVNTYYFENWGGSWRQNVFKDDTIPDNLYIYPTRDIGSTTSTTEVLVGTISYYYPKVYKNEAIIDGYVDGNIEIYGYNSGGTETAELTEVVLRAYIMDDVGTETTIETYDIDLSTPYSFPTSPGSEVSFPFIFVIDNQKILYNERFFMDVSVYGYSSGGSLAYFKMKVERNTDDFYITLPFV